MMRGRSNKIPITSEWTQMAFTASWTTNTTTIGWGRRVGDSLEGRIFISLTNAPDSTTLTVSIPGPLRIDTTKGPASLGAIWGLVQGTAAGIPFMGFVNYVNQTTLRPVYAQSNATQGADTYPVGLGNITQAVPATFASLDTISISFSVPIAGWKATRNV